MSKRSQNRSWLALAALAFLILMQPAAMAISILSQPASQSIYVGDTVNLGVAVDSSDCQTTIPGTNYWYQPDSYYVPQPDIFDPNCNCYPEVTMWQCDPPYCPPSYVISTWTTYELYYTDPYGLQSCQASIICTDQEVIPPCDSPFCYLVTIAPPHCDGCLVPQPDILITPLGYYTNSPSSNSPSQLHYQWYIGSSGDTSRPIGAPDRSQLSDSPMMDTTYWVQVTCEGGSTVDSQAAVVTVLPTPPPPLPVVNLPTANLPVFYGQSVTLTEIASGSGPLRYQWFVGSQSDTNQPVGTNSMSYTTTGLTNNEWVWVRVTDSLGQSADSPALNVTIFLPAPPSITPTVTNKVIAAGRSAMLSVNVIGFLPLHIQWFNGTPGDTSQPVGTDGSGYTTPTLTNGTQYWARLTDGVGQHADSSAMTVSVVPVGLNLGSVVACAGSDVTIPFTASGFAGIGSFQTTITWDPTVATYTGFGATGLPGLSADNFFGDPASGLVVLAWEDITAAGASVPDGSTLFSLNFHLTGAPGTTTPVVITNHPTPLEVADADGNVLVAALAPGQIAVNGSVNVSGNVVYYGFGTPVPNVSLRVGGGFTNSTLSGADGSFSLSVSSCVDLTLSADLTTDAPINKGVTVADVQIIRSNIFGVSHLTSPFALLAADVNGNGSITAADIREIRRFINNDITNFTAHGGSLWRFIPSDYVFPDPTAPWSAPGLRTLVGVTANASGQDFKAVKLGDVDGSWGLPAPLAARRISLQGTPPSPVQLSSPRQLVNPGDTIQVAVQASQVDRLGTAQFTLQWDPAVLRFNGTGGYGLTGMDAETFGLSRVGKGQLFVAWDDPTLKGLSVSSNQTLFHIEFKVIGGGGSATRIAVVNGLTPIELSVNGRIVATENSPGLVAVKANQPGTLGVVAHAGSQMDLWYEAPAGSSWIIQTSFDYKHWTQLTKPTPAPADGIATFSIPSSSTRQFYYRAIRLP